MDDCLIDFISKDAVAAADAKGRLSAFAGCWTAVGVVMEDLRETGVVMATDADGGGKGTPGLSSPDTG